MSNKLTLMTASLVSMTFAVAFLGMVQMVAASAGHIASAQITPAYGSPMLDIDDTP
ncbi:MAG TPA: hypothetical protein VGU24_12405 [Microvirga sp.]|jgi:hypothetical protein|nr:hypothetical protein [Microvirga sp.]